MPNILYSIIILFILCLSSCQNDSTPLVVVDSDQDTSASPEFEHRRFLSVNAQNLRIRRTPDLEGEVAITLPLNTIVEYLHDSTKFTTPITYNGQKYNSHWYKIRTANNIQGWVYGGLANFLTETENRRIITLEKSNEESGSSQNTNTKKIAPQKPEQTVLDRYKEQLNKLSSSAPQSISRAIDLYLNIFSTTNTITKDLGYEYFINFHSLMLSQLQQQNFNKYSRLQKEIETYGKAEMTNDEFTNRLGENGFNFGFNKATSTIYLKKDLDFVARHFYKEVSEAMREYIDQEQLEDETIWLENDKLRISPQQLAEWVIFWDNFLIKYPNFTLKSKALKTFILKLDLLLEGSTQTPAFANNQVLHSNFKTAYQWVLDHKSSSRFGLFFKDYYTILEQQNFKLTSATQQAQRKLKDILLPT